MLRFLQPLLAPDFDRFHFAYRDNRSVGNVIAVNSHQVFNYLETRNSYATTLLDYTSAFNSIIPQNLSYISR